MARKVIVGGSAVREWANSEAGAAALVREGLTVGKRGRFSKEVTDLFKSETGQTYSEGHVEPRVIKGTRVNASGRKTPVQVKATLPEVRSWARSPEGQAALGSVQVGERGVIAPAVLSAFAARPKV